MWSAPPQPTDTGGLIVPRASMRPRGSARTTTAAPEPGAIPVTSVMFTWRPTRMRVTWSCARG